MWCPMRNGVILVCCCLLLVLAGCSVDGSRIKRHGTITEADADVRIEPEVQDNFDKGVKELKEGNLEEAINLFEKVAKKARRHTAPFINLGIAYTKNAQYEKAEESFLKALELNPGHLVANTEIGLLYRKTGQFDKARTAYETALNTSPDYQPARKNLGILCDVYIGDLKCALKHFNEYLARSPGDEQVTIWVADISNRM